MNFTAYVDGSYDKTTGFYGYGVVLLNGGILIDEMHGYGKDEDGIWNVAGELAGVQKAIQYALDNSSKELHVCYDYEGIEAWATGLWRAKKSATKAYVDFVKAAQARGLSITFEKVKAHTGVKWNEEADALAKQGIAEAAKCLQEAAAEGNFYSGYDHDPTKLTPARAVSFRPEADRERLENGLTLGQAGNGRGFSTPTVSFAQFGDNNTQIASVQSVSVNGEKPTSDGVTLSLEEEVFLEKFCNPALKQEARAAYITLMKMKGAR